STRRGSPRSAPRSRGCRREGRRRRCRGSRCRPPPRRRGSRSSSRGRTGGRRSSCRGRAPSPAGPSARAVASPWALLPPGSIHFLRGAVGTREAPVRRAVFLLATAAIAAGALAAAVLLVPAVQDRVVGIAIDRAVRLRGDEVFGDDALRVAFCGTASPLPHP